MGGLNRDLAMQLQLEGWILIENTLYVVENHETCRHYIFISSM